MFTVYYILSVLAVFAGCILIKLLHRYTIEKCYKTNPSLIRFGDKLDLFYGKIFWIPPDEEKKND